MKMKLAMSFSCGGTVGFEIFERKGQEKKRGEVDLGFQVERTEWMEVLLRVFDESRLVVRLLGSLLAVPSLHQQI
jgi:hypothetical protein